MNENKSIGRAVLLSCFLLLFNHALPLSNFVLFEVGIFMKPSVICVEGQ